MFDISDNISEQRIQLFSVLGSLGLLFFILTLIKKRRLKEEYALLWIGASILFTALSIFRPALEYLAAFLGIHYAPTALLLMLIMAITIILIHYSTVISKLSEQSKRLTQELALLRHDLDLKRDSTNDHEK
ncbi:DUF2304 domain-containing protein [Marinagarivorans cellulosilyticus]|uniref:DUF2304 domain-containing protein n=1 Tax=Marinagarivorans cellulosilyticus TaxID=2721545 RepID=A0AAN2BJL5_9GAMM|nr:DUF2304 domain-containing protein [Marinagarivorans cellulosilyticus]BCD97069.1 hypothetical protein MARGE09_P1269 [Marinagarivorans cellulosilyticus]